MAQVEVERLGGGRAGVDPADPGGAQQGREGLRQATGAADHDVLAATRGQQRVAVAGQLVGGREGVGVRTQRGPPHLAEVAEQGPVGRQVEQEMALAQRLEEPGDPSGRDARADGHGVQAGQVEAAVEPGDEGDLGLAQLLEDDTRVGGQSDLQGAGAPAQQAGVRLESGSGRHRRLLRRPWSGRLWHAPAVPRPRRPQADGRPSGRASSGGRTPSGRARGGTRAVLVVPPRG